MISLQVVLGLCIAILLLLLSVSVYFNYKHGLIIITLVDEIERSLGILDEREESISKILEIPLFYDSPQVRQVHNDIIDCRDSILSITASLSNSEPAEDLIAEDLEAAE